MTSAKVGRRGQITLPRAVRGELEIEEGDQIAFVRLGKDIVLRPIRNTIRDFRGFVRVDGPQDFEAIRNVVRVAHSRHRAGRDT